MHTGFFRKGAMMREKKQRLIDEIAEQALQNDMQYMG